MSISRVTNIGGGIYKITVQAEGERASEFLTTRESPAHRDGAHWIIMHARVAGDVLATARTKNEAVTVAEELHAGRFQ